MWERAWKEPSSGHLPRSLPHRRVNPHGPVASRATSLVGITSPRWISKSSTTVTPDAGPRRRSSSATSGVTRTGTRYELNWVKDTGELYVMREPSPHIVEDPFGGTHSSIRDSEEAKMTVLVVGQIATHDELEEILAGWPEAMAGDGGAEWLAERLRSAGVAVGPEAIPDDARSINPRRSDQPSEYAPEPRRRARRYEVGRVPPGVGLTFTLVSTTAHCPFNAGIRCSFVHGRAFGDRRHEGVHGSVGRRGLRRQGESGA